MKAQRAIEMAQMLNIKSNQDFGKVPFGEAEYRNLLLHNDSEELLDLIFISNNDDFKAVPQSTQLPPNASSTISFCCTPHKLGICKGEILVQINSNSTIKIQAVVDCFEMTVEITPPEISKFKKTMVTKTELCSTTMFNRGERLYYYEIKKNAVKSEDDPLFSDPQFSIATLQGKIYPQGRAIITAQFTPNESGISEATAWIECTGRYNRIPLKLKATGIAPDVDFDVDVLQFEKITIGASSQVTCELRNYSEIQVEFLLQDIKRESPNEDPANDPILEFSQTNGIIPAASAVEITVTLTPRVLGQCKQYCLFQVLGCTNILTLEVHSETIAPGIELRTSMDEMEVKCEGVEQKKQVLDFGVVPYGFGSPKEIHLFNMSSVQQTFQLKIEPENFDETSEKLSPQQLQQINQKRSQQLLIVNDFNISPSEIRLEKNEHKSISVTLLPKHNASLTAYKDFYLNVYSKCQVRPLDSCMVMATVVNAKFQLSPSVKELLPSFVGFEHKISLEIKNISQVVGRWLFPPQELNDACVINCDCQTGVLAPQGVQKLTCTLIPRAPGNIVVPISFISDVGDKQQMQCMVQYNAVGPQVASSLEQLKFMNVRVLDQASRIFILTSKSQSDSRIRIAAAKPGSFFTVMPKYQDFILKAGQQQEVSVDFLANMQGNHTDQLLIHCELANSACDISDEVMRDISSVLKIKLVGEAKGTSLVCPGYDFSVSPAVDCGMFFTTEKLVKELVIENHGPEVQTLTWNPVSSKTQTQFLLQVENNKLSVEPGKFVTFVFTGKSNQPIDTRGESWMLRTNIAGKQTDTAFQILLQYKFVENQIEVYDEQHNQLQIGQNCTPIQFSYQDFPVYGQIEQFLGDKIEKYKDFIIDQGDGSLKFMEQKVTRKLKIKNVTQLGCRIQCLIKTPFFINVGENKEELSPEELNTQIKTGKQFESFVLTQNSQEQEIEVGIDPDFCLQDMISKEATGNLQIRLLPLQQSPTVTPAIKIPLIAKVKFPSVEFRCANQTTFNEFQNVDYDKYFDKIATMSSIDFGSTVPGTPINRYIFIKNVSEFPIQLKWELRNVKMSNCQFDITPSSIPGNSALTPNEISLFTCKFQCDAGEKPSMKISDVGAVCELVGGALYEYKISAQISNLAVDISPSGVNLQDISFFGESQQSIFIQNMSDVQTHLQLKYPKECIPFIKKLNDAPIGENNTWDFPLSGNQKKEVKLILTPRVPGRFYIPISIKIGHLEEILIPITGNAFIEQISASCNNQLVRRHDNLIPWKCDIQFPPFTAFLKAAHTIVKQNAITSLDPSTLDKLVQNDGSIIINGRKFECEPDLSIDKLYTQTGVIQMADNLVLTNIEHYKFQHQEETSKIVSRARSRQEKINNFTFINENPFMVIKTVSEIPKYPVLFHMQLELPACQRSTTTSQQITLTNTGQTPITISFERRYYFPFGISIEPEKISRLPANESITITLSYTPTADCPIGEQRFLIPFQFKTNAMGYLQCVAKVAIPTIKPMNLMALASNFAEFPINQTDNFTLHFGKCLFGRALRFSIQLQNPSQLPANFSCDVSGGSTKLYKLQSHDEIDLKDKIQNKLDDLFSLNTSNSSIAPNGETSISVVFRPTDCMQCQFGQAIVYKGELRFAIKTGVESISRVIINLVGLGYYPQIKVSQQQVTIPPVFPKEISQRISQLQLVNDSDQPFELYMQEFDHLYKVEDLLLNIIAQLDGSVVTKKLRNETENTYTLLFNEFVDNGETFSSSIMERLNQLGFEKITQFLIEQYKLFNGQNKIVKDFMDQMQKQIEQEQKKKDAKGKAEDDEAAREKENKSQVQPQNSDSQKPAKMIEFEIPFDNVNFSYPLTEDEKTQLKYGKLATTVKEDRSYRISTNDNYYSNLPFLIYLVHGAPLSGKSGICKKIQKYFNISGKTIPIIQFDNIIGDSETAKKFKKLQEDPQATQQKGKVKPQQQQVVNPNAYKKQPDYLSELAEEFVTKLNAMFEHSEDYVKIGMVFDGLQSQYIEDIEDFQHIFKRFIEVFMKQIMYDKQIPTARLAIFPIIMDLPPVVARKRAIESIISEYREAEMELQDAKLNENDIQMRMKIAKTAMIDAKQYYDEENQENDVTDKKEYQNVQQYYQKIFCTSDALGKQQENFLMKLQELDKLITAIKDSLFTQHKQMVDSNTNSDDKCQEQKDFDTTLADLEVAKQELSTAKKPQMKAAQQKVDDLQAKLEAQRKLLPPHPIDLVPIENLFQVHQIFIPNGDVLKEEDLFEKMFEKTLLRFVNALKIFNAVKTQLSQMLSNAKYNKYSTVEELLYRQCLNPVTVEQMKERFKVAAAQDEIIQTLNGQKNPNLIIQQLYQQLNDPTKQVFQVFPINSDYMEYLDVQIAKQASLKQEVDQLNTLGKNMSKQQQQELALKSKELQGINDSLSKRFSEQTSLIEGGFGRWIIPAKGVKNIYFRLMSNQIQKKSIEVNIFSKSSTLKIGLKIEAQCDWPHIIKDWTSILPASIKGYSKQANLMDFGFIRTGVPQPEIFNRALIESDPIKSNMNFQEVQTILSEKGSCFITQHFRMLQLENDSAFPANIAIMMDFQMNQNEQPQQALQRALEEKGTEQKVTKQEKKVDPKQKTEAKVPQAFQVFPNKLTLQPTEKAYVFLSTFPETTQPQQCQLYLGVEHNPEILNLQLKCQGVQPTIKYSVPECQTELVPCVKMQNDIQDMINKMQGIVVTDQKKKPAKDPKKEVKVENLVQLNIPRISLKNSQIAIIPFTNTSDLPLHVQFVPQFKDEQIKQFSQQFNFEQQALKASEVQPKKTDKVQTVMQALSNKFLSITNIKFMLKPQESREIRLEFSAKESTQLVIPGRLFVHQFGQKIDQESTLPQLNAFQTVFKTPIISNPLVIVCEAHHVDALVAVTEVYKSNDRIPIRDLVYTLDNPSTNMNFGICMALTHFQADAIVANNGPYDIQYTIEIMNEFKQQMNMLVPGEQEKGAKKGKEEVALQSVQKLEGVLPVLQAEPQKGVKDLKKSEVLDALKNNQNRVKFDFYALSQQDLSNQPFANVTFSDPTTKQLLVRTTLNVSVKVKYAQITVSPDRTLNFGDFAHGKDTQKTITVENTGSFPTQFAVEKLSTALKRYLMTGSVSQFTPEYTQFMAKVDRAKIDFWLGGAEGAQVAKNVKPQKVDPKAASLNVNSLTVGAFTISPTTFTLAPNQKQQITISFSARTSSEFREIFSLDFSNRFIDKPQGMIFSDALLEKFENDICTEFQTYKDNKDLTSLYQYKKGCLLDLNEKPFIKYCITGNSQIPGISSQPIDLFEEQQLVSQAISDPVQVTEGAQFSIMANQLCLGSCQLNSNIKERIKLYNPFSVETFFALLITPKNDSAEQVVNEQIGDTVGKVMAFFDQNGGSGLSQTNRSETVTGREQRQQAKPAPTKQDKVQETLVSNDDEAWKIDKQFIKIAPHESQYITVTYQPTKQVVSRSRFIAFSLDNWVRVNEQLKREKVDTDKVIYQKLLSSYTEQDKKNSFIDFKLLAVGVLPEVVIGPKFIHLKDVLINQTDQGEEQEVFIRNVGRVPSKFSVQIRTTRQSDNDFLQIVKVKDCDCEPENRLFTGLKEIKADEVLKFAIKPYLVNNLPIESLNIEGTVNFNIMISADKYNTLEIPFKLALISSSVCIMQQQEREKIRDKFMTDTLQFLFSIPETQNTQIVAQLILQSISDSTQFTAQRQLFTQAANIMQEKAEYKQIVYLNDGTASCENSSSFSLINQSGQVYRYDIDESMCQKLSIEVEPTKGHINAGQTAEIKIKLLLPQVEQDPKAKKPVTTTNRNILFGNPLVIKLTPIILKKYKVQPWDNGQKQVNYVTDPITQKAERVVEKLPEPEFDVILSQGSLMKYQKEYDEIQQLISKKTKLTPQQQARFTILQKIIENQENVESLMLVASTFIEANLFGCYHQESLKAYYRNELQLVALPITSIKEGLNQIDIPFADLPILQSARTELLLVNEGLSAPATQFISENASGAFTAVSNKVILPKPELYSNAIKEQYPQICDVPSIQPVMQKYNIGGKNVDKSFLSNLQAKYNNVETSPYSVSLSIQYEPKIPGNYEEFFLSKQAGLQFHISSAATLPLCHIECEPSKYLQNQRPASFLTPYIFANLLASNTKAVKVLQVSSVGVGVKSSSTLSILNTISQSYEIQIQRLPESSPKILTTLNQYVINAGEKLLLKFSYEPDKNSLKTIAEEAFYIIKIPAYDIKIPLLVVGLPQEPEVTLSTNKLNFSQVPYNSMKQLEVSIINKESSSFNYRILPLSAEFEVKIMPNQGIVPANGNTTIQLICQPVKEGKISQLVQIEISKKSMPLQLNIKYECYKQKHQLEILPENDQVGISTEIKTTYDLDLGTVFVADSKSRRLKITNIGLLDLTFTTELKLERIISTARRDTMELRKCIDNMLIKVEHAEVQNGIYKVGANSSAFIDILFQPREPLSMDKQFGLVLCLTVPGIGTQKVYLMAQSVRPGLHASLSVLDFGTVLTDLAMGRCQVKEIKFTNQDRQPLTLEYISESADFCVLTQPSQEPLAPGKSINVQIRFQPVFAQKFESHLNVTVNGLYKLRYELLGNAVHHNVQIDQPNVQMGALLIRQRPVYKQIQLRNKSLASSQVEVQLHKEYEVPNGLFVTLCQQDETADVVTRTLETMNGWEIRNQKKKYLENMQKKLVIAPNSYATAIVFYNPMVRMPKFTLPMNVIIEDCHVLEKAIHIEGSGMGAAVRLNQDSIDLPPCLENSFVQQDFQIENTGDVPINYIIDIPPKNIAKRSILQLFEQKILLFKPLSASIQPGQVYNVSVRFSPPVGYKPGKIEIPGIQIDYDHQGERKTIGSINVVVTCDSTQKFNSISTTTITFQTQSRQSETKQARVENATANAFEVKTVIQGWDDSDQVHKNSHSKETRHFMVPDRLVVPPGGLDFNLVYKPLSQAPAEDPHHAKLIIASPEGGAYIFELKGIATPPLLDGYITNITQQQAAQPVVEQKKDKKGAQQQVQPVLEIPTSSTTISLKKIVAYKPNIISIPAKNWETTMQRFVISHQFKDEQQKKMCKFTYPQFVDIAPNSTVRTVEISFVAFATMQFEGHILLRNEKTSEFLKYQFALVCDQIEPLQKLILETTVRDVLSKQVQVPNILQGNANLVPKCPRADIMFAEKSYKMSEKQVSIVSRFDFKPFVPFSNIDQVIEYEVSSIQEDGKELKLAPMQIMLQLTANPPRPSSPMKVQADIGKTLQFQIALKNDLKERIAFNSAITDITDIQEICSLLQNAQQTQAKGKESSIVDGKKLLQTLSCVTCNNLEVVAEPEKGFIVNLSFTPKQMGDYQAQVIIYNKTGGIWVIPIIGKCTKPPATGSIAFE